MDEVRDDEIMEALNRISVKLNKLDKLQEIVNILRLSQKATIDERVVKTLSKSPFRQAVYDLCDGTHTVSQISKALGKSMSQVSQAISQLLEADMLVENRQGPIKYYKRVL